MAPVTDKFAPQGGNAHRALSLAIDLHKFIAQNVDSLHNVGHIHGTTGIGNGLETLAPPARGTGLRHQTLDHRGGRKHRDVPNARRHLQDFFRVKTTAVGHNMPRAFDHMHEIIDPRPMRHRRGI